MNLNINKLIKEYKKERAKMEIVMSFYLFQTIGKKYIEN